MATKQLSADQHLVLHKHYPDDCCLCKAEKKCEELEKEVSRYKMIDRDPVEVAQLEADVACSYLSCHGHRCTNGRIKPWAGIVCSQCMGRGEEFAWSELVEKINKMEEDHE